jgi:U2-associated protein SR140
MSDKSKLREFPEISNKLTAPSKKSQYERQKADAEAKRQREKEETAAAYEEFVKAFDDDGPGETPRGNRGYGGSSRGGFGGPPQIRAGIGGGIGKRHFAPSGQLRSGPGSLGPGPLSQSRKRAFDGSFPQQRDRGVPGLDDSRDDTRGAFNHSDDDMAQSPTERAVLKPTLQLSSLPPGTSATAVKALLRSNLRVDGVQFLPSMNQSPADRRSLSVIITLGEDTPGSEIDTAVSSLQNRYLGRGYNLSISRHLSSATRSLYSLPTKGSSSLPFGAKVVHTAPSFSLNRAPPPNSFAPPASYNSSAPQRSAWGGDGAVVQVSPPMDLKQIKMIHKVVERVLQYGPEFEHLLMSRAEVHNDEKWAWLFDSTSVGHIWYRWRLWEIMTKSVFKPRPVTQAMFDGLPPWRAERKLKFEFVTKLEQFVDGSDYNSSEDDDDEEEQGPIDEEKPKYLGPLLFAKLQHLLKRLPTTTTYLQKRDISCITGFAIRYAEQGSEEVVDMLIRNVLRPFALKFPNYRNSLDDYDGQEDQSGNDGKDKEAEDPSSAKLIGLFAISDLLSSSSSSGVRHAWRYRQLFEAAFRSRKVFERLGMLDREIKWGRMKAEKWKRAVAQLLTTWEGWCVFSSTSQADFMQAFLQSAESKQQEKEQEALEDENTLQKSRSRWKAVDDEARAAQLSSEKEALDGQPMESVDDLDGDPMESDENLDGEPMDSDENLDGEPVLSDDNLDGEPMDGEPMDGSNVDGGEPIETDPAETNQVTTEDPTAASGEGRGQGSDVNHAAAEARRRRPKAMDMFAESDED